MASLFTRFSFDYALDATSDHVAGLVVVSLGSVVLPCHDVVSTMNEPFAS